MKPSLIVASVAALALAACGQPATEEKAAEPAAPQSLVDQVNAMSLEQQPVFAWEQLVAYQGAHPEAQPPCTSVRATESRGVIPADVAPDSAYAQFAGSHVFSVQCGPQLTATRMDPREHWLVVFPEGATEPTVFNCAGADGRDVCPRVVPTAAAPAAPAAGTTKTN